MPTYEYRCEKGHTFERVQKMSEKAVTRCPVCGAKAARVISGGQGLIFKGSGFYITDYGKDGKGPRQVPDAPAAPEAKADAVAAPAAKPEAAAPTKSAAAPAKPSKKNSA
jgi:putative FmdB family regulatory protein